MGSSWSDEEASEEASSSEEGRGGVGDFGGEGSSCWVAVVRERRRGGMTSSGARGWRGGEGESKREERVQRGGN